MKNIHILSTKKPSRLYLDENKKLQYIPVVQHNYNNCVNIYITSDEEIKEGDWVIHVPTGKIIKVEESVRKADFRKIILTDNEYLINDNVQAIPDEFLEWFVKNPECKEVKVKHKEIIQYGNMTMYDHNGDGSHYFCKDCEVETSRSKEELLKFGAEYYKIIIPKEEPNQDIIMELQKDPLLKDFDNQVNKKISFLKQKQETLKEVAEKYSKKSSASVFQEAHKRDFIAGAKWQQERSYSEEDMIQFAQIYLSKRNDNPRMSNKDIFNLWFEKFKKK